MAAHAFPSFVTALPLTRRALAYASERHGEQRREADDAAFILHPLEVAQLLRNRDYPDHVVAAGVLHDVLEDTPAQPDELERQFGAAVADLVCAVSEPPGDGDYVERKARLRNAVACAGPEAAAIYAADKVAKTRELRLRLVRDPRAAAETKTSATLDHYWASLELLEHQLPAHPFVAQLRFELEALAILPPRTS